MGNLEIGDSGDSPHPARALAKWRLSRSYSLFSIQVNGEEKSKYILMTMRNSAYRRNMIGCG